MADDRYIVMVLILPIAFQVNAQNTLTKQKHSEVLDDRLQQIQRPAGR